MGYPLNSPGDLMTDGTLNYVIKVQSLIVFQFQTNANIIAFERFIVNQTLNSLPLFTIDPV